MAWAGLAAAIAAPAAAAIIDIRLNMSPLPLDTLSTKYRVNSLSYFYFGHFARVGSINSMSWQ